MELERRGSGLERLAQDVRYGLRVLRKSPGYAAAAVLTLTLGIGANTAIFSVVDAVLLKPLPYPHPERLVFLAESLPKARLNVSWPDFQDWRAQNQVFEQLAAFQPNRISVQAGGESKQVPAIWVSASFFTLLGARPAMGRAFTESDDRAGAPGVAVASYSFWRNELKGDPNAVGKALPGDASMTVVGVLPAEFRFEPFECDVFLPIAHRTTDPSWVDRANHPGIMALASLRPGISIERARSDMNAIMDRLGRAYPESNRNETVILTPMAEQLVGWVRSELLMLAGAVAFVLLIACANVAHLALARAASRSREFAIRRALGAGTGRLMRQLLVESTMIALLGGAAGSLVALWGVPAMVNLYPYTVPGLKAARLDSGVLLFTLAVSLAVGLAFGLAPIMSARRAQLYSAASARQGQPVRATLLAAEVAIALVLAVGAGLLLRSMAAVLDVDPGFRPERLLAMSVIRNGKADPAQDRQFFDAVIESVRKRPGVEAAAAAMCPPMQGTTWSSPYWLEGQPVPAATQRPWTALNMVTPGFFETVGARLLEGRFFTARDDAHAPAVAIVSRTLARRLWPNEPAAGKRIHVQYAENELLQIVGVAADIKQWALDSANMPEVYVPAAQMPVGFMTVLVRTTTGAGPMAASMAAAVREVDRGQAVSKVTPVSDAVVASLARRRFATLLLGLFSAVALALAAVGVSGVMACAVAQRTRELGIRMALGARRSHVLALVFGQALRLAGIGVAIGIAAAWGLTRFLKSQLFGVKAHDPLTFAAMAGLLAAVAAAACWLPARRAARVDPMVTLRAE
ncbi:MAG TPA: ABC transporter permease [Bryobacteraceae bacterium]